MVERRRFARIPVELKLRFRSIEQLEKYAQGSAGDLSMGGIYIATTHVKPTGTQVKIELPGGEDEFVGIKGVVRSIRYHEGEAAGMGIEFEDMDEQARRLIQYLLEKHQG